MIRNTVSLAQETYIMLRDSLRIEGIEVELFHARFPFGRRHEIEDAVLTRFGKDGGPEERHKRVLVATQVIEQSLDLDFDLMFSDLAPVDLVLQRAGRLHRHARSERPERVKAPTLWLIEPGLKDGGRPDFGNSEAIYARFVLLRSLIVLKARVSVSLPEELETLVEQVYGNVLFSVDKDIAEDLSASEVVLRNKQEQQALTASNVSINFPDEKPLHQPNAHLEEDAPEAHRKIQAVTRDSDPTIQLILVYRLGDGDYLDPEGKEPLDCTVPPDPKCLKRLLENEVTISRPRCVFHYLSLPVPEGWKKCGMLRYHRMVRLNEGGQSVEGEFPMQYDWQRGILF